MGSQEPWVARKSLGGVSGERHAQERPTKAKEAFWQEQGPPEGPQTGPGPGSGKKLGLGQEARDSSGGDWLSYPLKQWAAVTTQRLVSREPAQWWVPFFWMLTTQGHSESALSSPPTIRFSCWGFPQSGGAGRGRFQFLLSPWWHSPRPLPSSLRPPQIVRLVLHASPSALLPCWYPLPCFFFHTLSFLCLHSG